MRRQTTLRPFPLTSPRWVRDAGLQMFVENLWWAYLAVVMAFAYGGAVVYVRQRDRRRPPAGSESTPHAPSAGTASGDSSDELDRELAAVGRFFARHPAIGCGGTLGLLLGLMWNWPLALLSFLSGRITALGLSGTAGLGWLTALLGLDPMALKLGGVLLGGPALLFAGSCIRWGLGSWRRAATSAGIASIAWIGEPALTWLSDHWLWVCLFAMLVSIYQRLGTMLKLLEERRREDREALNARHDPGASPPFTGGSATT